VPGGGVALMNAAKKIKAKNKGEEILLGAILSPYRTILDNAGLTDDLGIDKKGWGKDVVTGKPTNMIRAGIIDPAFVTKTALKNAVSVVNTIISADCIINNMRLDESN
jgi:chaperonin GroEL